MKFHSRFNDPRNLVRNLPAAQRSNRAWPREGRRGPLPPTGITKTYLCQFCGFEPPEYPITHAAAREMFANPQGTCCRDSACMTAYVSQLTTEI